MLVNLCGEEQACELSLAADTQGMKDLLGGGEYPVAEGALRGTIGPYETQWLKVSVA